MLEIDLIAIGTRMPDWVTQGYQKYSKRLSGDCKLRLMELPLAKRQKNSVTDKLKQQEAEQIRQKLGKQTYLVALDEHGQAISTQALAHELQRWQDQAESVAIVIGGPDGLDRSLLQQANQIWSLSAMTLPHPLVRIILAEQIYRAFSILKNHPYHR